MDEGREHTSWVYFEEEMFTSWHSFILKMESVDCFRANETSEIISFSRDDIQYLKHSCVDFVYFLNSYYEFSIGFYDYFTKKLPALPAIENYKFILENYPKLIQRASNSDIASIIGVSRETVSRVRAQLSSTL